MKKVLTFAALHDSIGAERSPKAFSMWLRREERAGRFPERIRLSARCLGWEEAAVSEWLASRPRGTSAEAA